MEPKWVTINIAKTMKATDQSQTFIQGWLESLLDHGHARCCEGNWEVDDNALWGNVEQYKIKQGKFRDGGEKAEEKKVEEKIEEM